MSTIELTSFQRILRSIKFTLIVGFAGLAISAVPALFIQSVFVAEAQRCIEAIEISNAGGDAPTNCIDGFKDPPVWLPPIIILGGGVIGSLGGLGYGVFTSPKSRNASRKLSSESWLPF